ncbi:hypothetical protein HN51_009021 [Arachis hypogaea]|uniref:DHHA1 domain-containing protein n=1 Tax=Arachis hypogaea TaxID=3818 RepID=A0A445D101_ARAHY|nr:uncharacterized protein LOC112802437 [Arachis hypogaea]QHO43426.1 uncharacterized protein DS421_5g162730 [Arachis hypogaea]RYR56877.1 hypothetical protein Ahy_A05g022605 [Arachis hypogaea]
MAAAAILYHYPCPDGAFAALAAHLYFKATCLPSLFFPNTVYRPLTPHDLPLTQISHLYLLDFVGPPHFLQDISAKVQRVIVLDHHKTALEMLGSENLGAKNVDKVIDMERSGATIALDYFKEKLMNHDAVKHQYVLDEFERVRQLFRYIEDGDLWRWKLHNSKAFSSGLKDLNIEFDVRKNPSMFDQLLSLDLDCVISQGMKSLSHKQKLMDDCISKSYEIALGNGAFGCCLAVDADTTLSELRSELGHQLAMKSQKMKLRGIGAIVYKVPELENDHKFKISLRSVENEDTTPISQEFGGGGHRNASSFMLSCEEFEQWKV